MGNWMHEAEKSHNNRILAEYEEYKQRVKDLKVTPLGTTLRRATRGLQRA